MSPHLWLQVVILTSRDEMLKFNITTLCTVLHCTALHCKVSVRKSYQMEKVRKKKNNRWNFISYSKHSMLYVYKLIINSRHPCYR